MDHSSRYAKRAWTTWPLFRRSFISTIRGWYPPGDYIQAPEGCDSSLTTQPARPLARFAMADDRIQNSLEHRKLQAKHQHKSLIEAAPNFASRRRGVWQSWQSSSIARSKFCIQACSYSFYFHDQPISLKRAVV